ncbi:MAG: magnesium transporter [Bacillota bacterium]
MAYQLKQLLEITPELKLFVDEYQNKHPADIAEALPNLNDLDRARVFLRLDGETAALVFRNLKTEVVNSLIEALGSERVAAILDEMPFDDAADFLGEVSQSVKEELLDLMEAEEAKEVKELLAYPDDSAGGIMTTEYVAILEDATAGRALEVLREVALDVETIYYIYVINCRNQLAGVISLRELIVASPESAIKDIMQENIISVNILTDQEEVAKAVTKYGLLAIPVTDNHGCLVGIVTVDDVIDVIHEEASEDIYRLAGTKEINYGLAFPHRITSSIRSRLPWLLITLLGGMLAGSVLHSLEDELNKMVALAFFIPLLTGMGGNVGTQSSTLTVRGIATGDIQGKEAWLAVLREGVSGIFIGTICGFIVGTVALVMYGNWILGLVVGMALLGNMTTAATMGTLVPLIFKKVGVDPAVASAPFISTSIDITGLLIYSGLASALIAYLV